MTTFKLNAADEASLESEVGPKGFWYETQNFQIDFLKSQGLKADHKVLDIGCGVLRGGLPLIFYLNENGYTGVDIRPAVIETAEDLIMRFGLSDKCPTLAVSDTYGQNILNSNSQDLIFVFQVLYHLADQLAQDCLRACANLLSDAGAIYANVHCDNVGKTGKWKEFPFVPRTLETYATWADDHNLVMTNMGRLKEHGYPLALGGCENFMLKFEKA